jgi:hypothetical protein
MVSEFNCLMRIRHHHVHVDRHSEAHWKNTRNFVYVSNSVCFIEASLCSVRKRTNICSVSRWVRTTVFSDDLLEYFLCLNNWHQKFRTHIFLCNIVPHALDWQFFSRCCTRPDCFDTSQLTQLRILVRLYSVSLFLSVPFWWNSLMCY